MFKILDDNCIRKSDFIRDAIKKEITLYETTKKWTMKQYAIINKGEVINPPSHEKMELLNLVEDFDHTLKSQANALDEAVKQMTAIYVDKVDEIIEEGLKLKGFQFNNRFELTEFIKANCVLEHNLKTRHNIYYVNGIPFLSQSHIGNEMLNIKYAKSGIGIWDIMGEFKYL